MIPMNLLFPGGLSKALTLSYDDGVEQDADLISILDRHGIRATFNLNSGLFAPEGTVWPQGQIHRRLTEKAALALYGGTKHEVAVHCLTHASLPALPPSGMVREIYEDRQNLERIFGTLVRGSAYPYGAFSDAAADTLRMCGICYARTVISSHRFDLPLDWLRLPATCHHDDPQLFELCDRFLAGRSLDASFFYLWGHAYEFEEHDNWHVIRRFCEKMGGHSDIWYCTNIEAYDYIQAYRSLVFSSDGHTLFNPSFQDVWFSHNSQTFCIPSGQILKL